MNYYGYECIRETDISHHGIKGQRWGVRRASKSTSSGNSRRMPLVRSLFKSKVNPEYTIFEDWYGKDEKDNLDRSIHNQTNARNNLAPARMAKTTTHYNQEKAKNAVEARNKNLEWLYDKKKSKLSSEAGQDIASKAFAADQRYRSNPSPENRAAYEEARYELDKVRFFNELIGEEEALKEEEESKLALALKQESDRASAVISNERAYRKAEIQASKALSAYKATPMYKVESAKEKIKAGINRVKTIFSRKK